MQITRRKLIGLIAATLAAPKELLESQTASFDFNNKWFLEEPAYVPFSELVDVKVEIGLETYEQTLTDLLKQWTDMYGTVAEGTADYETVVAMARMIFNGRIQLLQLLESSSPKAPVNDELHPMLVKAVTDALFKK